MKYLISFLCIFWVFDQAFSEECPTRNERGEACISATPSVETDGDWITYKESVRNSCDCTCNADFTAIDSVAHGAIVAPHDKGEVICLNVRGKGCRGFERSFRFTCQREGGNGSGSPRQGSNGAIKNDQSGSDENPTSPGRNFSKDQCRDDACASADYEITENWRLTNAAKAICDQQYLQCLQDGQAKPDFQAALRIARTQVPAETPPPEPEPAPPPVPRPSRPVYQSQNYGQLVDCFWDPIFKARNGVPVCLAQNWFSAGGPCDTIDIVNGQQAYICQGGGEGGPGLFRSRKSQYGGGRSW
jgi:hypothetical protein